MYLRHSFGKPVSSWSAAICGVALLGASTAAHAVPSRQWGTYYGGDGFDFAHDVAFGSSDDIDVVGQVSSAGIATLGSHDNQLTGGSDAYVAQFDSTGNIVWATYYGGHSTERFSSLVHDASDNIYAFGDTSSDGFIATLGAHQITLDGSSDAMLVKFDASGARQWGTYFGGNGAEIGQDSCSNGSGTTYIVGGTLSSTGLATAGAHDTVLDGTPDGYIAKFNASGVLQWATYYGGPGRTTVQGCAVDAAGNVYATGTTNVSSGIATTGAHDTTLSGPEDAFLVKFNPSGVRQWATYYGGNFTTQGLTVGVDPSNNVYMAGSTSSSTTIATAGAMDTTLNDSTDAYVVKFNAAGVRQWGTYFGGSNGVANGNTEELFWDIDVTAATIFLSGRTDSINSIATAGAWNSTNPTGAIVGMFVMLTTGGAMNYASYHGVSGNNFEQWRPGVAVSSALVGRAAIVGETGSATGVATAGTHDTTYNGATDSAITYVHLFDQ